MKLFIAVVDAELLETVFAEYLKAVDVKETEHSGVWNIGVSGGRVYGGVDLGHDPGKKLVIHRLKKLEISRNKKYITVITFPVTSKYSIYTNLSRF